jgi:OOP family OmpA-OmpF porin
MNKKLFALSAVLITGNSLAIAQDNPWYAGARIGATHYSDFNGNISSDDLKDDDDLGGGVFLGYNVNEWFALESGYTYLGKLDIDNNQSIKTHALDFVGKFTWQATDSFDVFLKAGGYGYHTKGGDDLSSYKDTDIDGTAGVGVEKHFTDNFSARLEYQYYNNVSLDDGGFDSKWDTHLFAFGLVYSWGGSEPVAAPAPVAQAVEEVIVAEPLMIQVDPTTVEIYFDFDKFDISPKSAEQLQPMLEHLEEYPESTAVLVGHTDSTGSEEFNQKLSEERAEAVEKFLSEEHSISVDRITTSGEGETNPIASNDTKEGRAKNRRVSVYSPSFKTEEK